MFGSKLGSNYLVTKGTKADRINDNISSGLAVLIVNLLQKINYGI